MKKSKKRWMGRLAALLLATVVCLIGWNYIKPMVVVSAETVYESYTVKKGSILNTMCFSASLSLSNSETLSPSANSTVRNIFVEESQRVVNGDKLVQLTGGEIIRAGIDGMVNEIFVTAGDAVYPDTALLQICDLTNMKVSIRVDEYDIDRVSIGQNCTVTIMSLGRSFDTQISHINRISSSSGAVAYYTVTAEVAVPEDILPGMQASVSIPSAEAIEVPVLDMNALMFDDEKKPYVLVKNADGGYEKTSVEVGLNDGLKVEIKSGPAVGDVVYAMSGSERVEPMFSFLNLYKAIVGETVVINDMSRRGNFMSGEMPTGRPEGGFPVEFDAEGAADIPAGERGSGESGSRGAFGSAPPSEDLANGENENNLVDGGLVNE